MKGGVYLDACIVIDLVEGRPDQQDCLWLPRSGDWASIILMENQIDKNVFPVTIPEKQRFLALFIKSITLPD